MESILTELINQKIISNKQTSSDCDSLYKSKKSANNSDIIRNSFKNQANLDASHISLKDFIPSVIVKTLQPKNVVHNKSKPEEGMLKFML